MSLYDGLDCDTDQQKDTGWSPQFQMLKSHLQVRKAVLSNAKTKKAGPSTIAPVIDFQKLKHNGSSNQLEDCNESSKSSVFLGGEVLEKFIDEYNPLHPNDYEKMALKDREAEIEKRRKRRAARHAQRELEETTKQPGDYDSEADKIRAMAGKVAIAPPTALLEADNQSLSKSLPPTSDRDSPPPAQLGAGTQFASNLAGSVAHRIMSKYGFKEGRGLGKDNRGMTFALQVEKTSKRGGKIISSDQTKQKFEAEQQSQQSFNDLLKNPTKVVCLRNMVGPGEVDPDLQAETSDECTKYGVVSGCLIFEMPGVAEDEAVRIFVEFERVESATKAVVDLNGRFFGGRTVKASFYDLEKYKQFQLAEPIT